MPVLWYMVLSFWRRAQDTISYSLLTNLSIEQGGIEQRFVENADGSITLQLFVSPSLLANYPNSIDFDLVIGYDDSSITQSDFCSI